MIEKALAMIELVDAKDSRAVRNKNNVLGFYDVVINGVRHERAAWSYEAPRPSLQHVGGWFGFWHEVEVA